MSLHTMLQSQGSVLPPQLVKSGMRMLVPGTSTTPPPTCSFGSHPKANGLIRHCSCRFCKQLGLTLGADSWKGRGRKTFFHRALGGFPGNEERCGFVTTAERFIPETTATTTTTCVSFLAGRGLDTFLTYTCLSVPRQQNRGMSRANTGAKKGMARAAATVLTETETTKSSERAERPGSFFQVLLRMSRPHNLLPAGVLVFLGASLGCGSPVAAMFKPKVWLVGCLCAVITAASMIANDVFDFYAKVDSINAPGKPIVAGLVKVEDAELAAGCLYSLVMLGSCCLEPLLLRLLVVGAAVGTYLYTPFFKPLTLVKNAFVAATVASSVLAGALSAGGTWADLVAGFAQHRVLLVASFLFKAILFREIIMDVHDMPGDSAAGIPTVPVRLGPRAALLVACSLLGVAHAELVYFAPASKVFLILITACLAPLYWMTLSLLPGFVFKEPSIARNKPPSQPKADVSETACSTAPGSSAEQDHGLLNPSTEFKLSRLIDVSMVYVGLVLVLVAFAGSSVLV